MLLKTDLIKSIITANTIGIEPKILIGWLQRIRYQIVGEPKINGAHQHTTKSLGQFVPDFWSDSRASYAEARIQSLIMSPMIVRLKLCGTAKYIIKQGIKKWSCRISNHKEE